MKGWLVVAKNLALAAVILAGILATSPVSVSCRAGYSGKVEAVAFGSIMQEMSTLVFAAQEQGYFAANGLDVSLKNYDTGLASADGLLKGEVDLAGAQTCQLSIAAGYQWRI